MQCVCACVYAHMCLLVCVCVCMFASVWAGNMVFSSCCPRAQPTRVLTEHDDEHGTDCAMLSLVEFKPLQKRTELVKRNKSSYTRICRSDYFIFVQLWLWFLDDFCILTYLEHWMLFKCIFFTNWLAIVFYASYLFIVFCWW